MVYLKRLVILVLLVVALTIMPVNAQTFDNSGGGSWTEYMSFPITVAPIDYAQYKIVINGTAWEIYNVTGVLEASGTSNNFWNLVNSTGADIRVFDQNGNQLYFWIEHFNVTEQKAIIWVNITPGSSELNVAYGNPGALPSAYMNGSKVFELFDDFDTLDLTKWQRLSDANNEITVVNGELRIPAKSYIALASTKQFDRNIVIMFRGWFDDPGQDSALTTGWISNDGTWLTNGYFVQWSGANGYIAIRIAGTATPLASYTTTLSANTYYRVVFTVSSTSLNLKWYDDRYNLIADLSASDTTYTGTKPITLDAFDASGTGFSYWDYIAVAKLSDPADFGNGVIKTFQKMFGSKTVFVNVTYLDTLITNRYNPTAYYKLEDKPQINVTSQLSVSGVNETYGANISIELINFVTLDKVVYNGTDITANLTYQGAITNSTTGYVYNVYNFTTYENGTLEIYGHVGNKAYNATYKLDGDVVDIFNTTAIIGEVLEVALPYTGNITLANNNYVGVTVLTINTKNLGTGLKTLTIVIDDPENFTVGYKSGSINIAYGSLNVLVRHKDYTPFTNAIVSVFNEDYTILSSDTNKLYAGNNRIDVFFHGIKLKSVVYYLNHSTTGANLTIDTNSTSLSDYRGFNRTIASSNGFEIVNLSTNYPYSVMEIRNYSGTVIIDYGTNPPTSVEVTGADFIEYLPPVLKISGSGNATVIDLYKLTVTIKDRLGNPLNFYITINGTRVDASKGVVVKLLRPNWYEIVVPITINGFELWKFNKSSNRVVVEINTSDVVLPNAEYRVPSKIESNEVRLTSAFNWIPIPFLSPKQNENVTVVRLEGSLKDVYGAPVIGRPIKIEISSKNFTRIYNVTTDESGNFRLEVDMAKGVEYQVRYIFEGDDVYVGTSSTKTFYVEQLLLAPVQPTPIALVFVVVVLTGIAIIAVATYFTRKRAVVTRVKLEREFKYFKRLK